MEWYKEGGAFENLRRLAQRFDIKLGIERRKLILAGNERLTLGTDEQGWKNWMVGVESRLTAIVGEDAARDLLLQTGTPSPNSGLPANDKN